jgi:CubicO group peptidase (beta-lactamase class C family)
VNVVNADENRELATKFDQYLAHTMNKHGVVGYSAIVLRNGEEIYSSFSGKASVELDAKIHGNTVFQSFSLAKLFANVVVMQLIEDNSLNLNDRIGKHLHNIPENWKTLTVSELLSHTSGLPEYYQWPARTPKTPEDAIASIKDKPFVFQTGNNNRYNQTNYLLLKMMIEKITGTSFVDVMRSRIIKKLHLQHTFYGGEFAIIPNRASTYSATAKGLVRNGPIDQPDYMFASTGLNISPRDLLIYFQALLEGKLINKSTLKMMWSPSQLNTGKLSSFVNGWEFFQRNNMKVFGHGGGNRVDIRHFIDPADNKHLTVIYFTNGYRDRNFWPGNVSIGLASILIEYENKN